MVFILFFLLLCIPAGITYFLWNLIIPDIFGLPTIAFWQAYCLVWLIKLLSGLGK